MATLFLSAAYVLSAQVTGKYTLIGWNDLGMHCVDGMDYSVFSILPPYNNVHSQLVANGKLVKTATGYRVTYQAVADPTGSINKTSNGKTNFWLYTQAFFGLSLPIDTGLAGNSMPGAANTPQPFGFNSVKYWFGAEGIPITPYDDAKQKNYYPMMRLIARDSAGTQLAKTDVVLPVSDEMDCRVCHGSGKSALAKPRAGWVYDPDPLKDYKRNILLLHDDRHAGLNLATSTPVLCASCHGSNALPGTGKAGIKPLTSALHGKHANVIDPANGMTLNSETNRSACYNCHPGSTTKCLRGAMGNAGMQCQSCHGSMSLVASSNRQGWLNEPTCQNCHTGTATKNSGQLVYTSAFSSTGVYRTAADQTFATNPNTPSTGYSLYRQSSGHGGLQCEACHGATHAEYPSSHVNDNIQSIALQGYAGTVAECTACHATVPSTVTGGPHGLHPIGQSWVGRHHDVISSTGTAPCQKCHGLDYRGTILSKTQTNRTFSADGRTVTLAKGTIVGCYTCHNGPRGD